MLIADKSVKVVVDSGASCNLMSEDVFVYVTGGRVSLSETSKKVFTYASAEPLSLKRKCNLCVTEPRSGNCINVDFYITPRKAATLLVRRASELLGVQRWVFQLAVVTLNPTGRLCLERNFPKCSRVWESSRGTS